MLHIFIEQPENQSTLVDLISKLGPLFALVGVLGTIFFSWRSQRNALAASANQQIVANKLQYDREVQLAELERNRELRLQRGALFAKLCRIYRTIRGEYEYLATSELRFIWFAFYSSLLPSTENYKQIELFSSREVFNITAFYYSYHEQIGYIASASGGIGKTAIKFDFDMIGVDVTADHLQLKWVFDAMQILERKSLFAMDSILKAAREAYGLDDDLYKKMLSETGINTKKFFETYEFTQQLEDRIDEA